MIVALEVPLVITVRQRAQAELRAQTLISAQSVAAFIGGEGVAAPGLQKQVVGVAEQVGGRVIVVDTSGKLIADSEGTGLIGTEYATPDRPELQQALDRRPVSEVRHSDLLGQDIIAAAAPILDESKLFGAVRITRQAGEIGKEALRLTLGLLAIGLAGLIAGLILAFILAESFSKPLTRLADTAQELGEGDLSVRATDIGGALEIEELADSFNDMAERLARAMEAQREFVANASHQLRTPLTGMKLRIEGAVAKAPSAEVLRNLEAADREVDRLSRIVQDLLAASKGIERPAASATADVGDAVERSIARWEARAEGAATTLRSDGGGGSAAADPADIDQILDNLLDNAISYAPGPVTVSSGRDDGELVLSVRDEGPGIPPGDLAHVTERFYRGKGSPPGGTGLGLAIVRDLAERWGGSVAVRSTPEHGTCVDVRLPATGE